MHGIICGEVEDPDGGNEMYRISLPLVCNQEEGADFPPLSNPPKRKEVEGAFPAPGSRLSSSITAKGVLWRCPE